MMSYDRYTIFLFQRLGSPTLTVTNESFVPMLSRLDDCILYINNNVSLNVTLTRWLYNSGGFRGGALGASAPPAESIVEKS